MTIHEHFINNGIAAHNKLKLLVFHPYLAPYRMDFFNALAKLFDLKIIFMYENLPEQKFNQDCLREKLNCNYSYLLSGVNINRRQLRLGVYKEINLFHPDVIVCHEFGPTTTMVSMLKMLNPAKKIKLLVTTDDSLDICSKVSFIRSVFRYFNLKYIDCLITVNNKVAGWYKTNYPKLKIIGTCPIIQSEDVFRSNLSKAIPFAKSYVLNNNLQGKKIVLCVSRLAAVKGIDRTLKAFYNVLKEHKDTIMVVVGEGDERNELFRIIKELNLDNNVKFVGRYEGTELLGWYLLGHVFVLASHYEPFGAVVNEALLSGIPVVCSSKAGAASLIEEGKNGGLVDPLDVAIMSSLIKRLIKNVEPIDINSLCVRDSLMPFNFKLAIDEFESVVVDM